jgi:hypothetical protein
MTISGLLSASVFALFCANMALAGGVEQNSQRLTIGSTGVLCYQMPCPWRGVVNLEEPSADRLRPLWSGDHIPGLIADPADRQRIVSAWEALECLEIEGAFITLATHNEPRKLRIDRILGACT